MRDRVQALGGRLEIDTVDDGSAASGTEVRAHLPQRTLED
jgi:signal transduction histidine kinase